MAPRTVKGPTTMKRSFAVAALVAVVATACGGASSGNVAVDDPWARTSAMMQSAGAVYMELSADEADALVAASVDPSIAPTVEIHETSGDGDMMSMSPVDSIELPAGGTVTLEPGGYHIMVLGLVAPLEDGQTFDLTLEFENGGTQTVEVEVRDN
jgi:copper(I)-binding protein